VLCADGLLELTEPRRAYDYGSASYYAITEIRTPDELSKTAKIVPVGGADLIEIGKGKIGA